MCEDPVAFRAADIVEVVLIFIREGPGKGSGNEGRGGRGRR